MNWRRHLCVPVALAAGALCLAALARAADTQPVPGGEGFEFSEYYDPPNDKQMKWDMECARPSASRTGECC